jgi:hypothetical protein
MENAVKMKDEIARTAISNINNQTLGIKYMARNYAPEVMRNTLPQIF